jgi:hypothetical protein
MEALRSGTSGKSRPMGVGTFLTSLAGLSALTMVLSRRSTASRSWSDKMRNWVAPLDEKNSIASGCSRNLRPITSLISS